MYSQIDGIRVYVLPGSLDSSYEDGVWNATELWSGSFVFPHHSSDYISYATQFEYKTIGYGDTPTPTAEYATLLSYVPDFGRITGVVNGAVSPSRDAYAHRMFINSLQFIRPGVSGAALHIVTKDGSRQAYAYVADADKVNAVYPAVPASIASDGSISFDGSIRLCMPRLQSTHPYWAFWGCTIRTPAEDGRITLAVDFKITGFNWYNLSPLGRQTRFYPMYEFDKLGYSMDLCVNTAAFLTEWLRPEDSFDHGSFLQGYRVGSIMSQRGKGPQIVSAGTPTAGTSTYHEKSFLSGMAAGYAGKGVWR